jgi:hypothetical protein
MCVTWQWKWLLFSSLTVQGVWQVFILLESPFWGLQRSMPSIVLQTYFFLDRKSGFDIGIYSVLFWIPYPYGKGIRIIFPGFRSKHNLTIKTMEFFFVSVKYSKIQRR